MSFSSYEYEEVLVWLPLYLYICDKMYISPRKDCGFFADRIDKTPLTEVY